MLVEDDASLSGLLEARLGAAGYSVVAFSTAVEALAALTRETPALVLMDIGLPGLDGVEACKRVASEYPNVPVVLITSRAEVEDRVMGLEAGARDYISKPFASRELLARVKVILREAALRETAQQRVKALESLALIDPLTRVSNRRYLELRYAEELARSVRYARPISCLMLDVDDFKAINDTYGHSAGDGVLVAIADLLQRSLRAVDTLVRYGGEEFVIVMPETEISGALAAANRIRTQVASAEIGPHSLRVTISIGAATGATDDLLFRADQAMYTAKRAGKNRVEPWDGRHDGTVTAALAARED
jgi:two-component system cell cycle response regulator